MELRRLGGSGLVVSVLGLGCNNLGRPGTRTATQQGTSELIETCLDLGVCLFDVADAYGSPRGRSEELLGAALGDRRDEAVIATKFGADMAGANGADFGSRASRRYIRRAVEGSLRRLDTDWIDLYQLHHPDPATPVGETLSVLDDLVREGKIRYAGVCNLAGWEIADAAWTARTGGLAPPVSVQDHYSLLERDVEREIIPACEHFDLAVLPYFPLAGGLLSGKYKRRAKPPEGTRLADQPRMLQEAPWSRIEQLAKFAGERELTLLDLALGGLAAQPTVGAVLVGATAPEQVRANAAAVEWHPDTDDLAELDMICPPGRS